LLGVGCDRGPSPIAPVVDPANHHRGVNLVAGRTLPSDTFDHLLEANVDWIAQTPFGWQPRYDVPRIELRTTAVLWGETDEGLRETARRARMHGVKTMLKPHIWLQQEVEGEWRGTIRFEREEDWVQWEEDYRRFALHYARLAAEAGMEMFCIGIELRSSIRQRPLFWRNLIAEVRQIYKGPLTYGANWFQEYQEVGFWDQLDYIGIHAYFPLTQQLDATVADLERGWQPHLRSIEALQREWDRPILFTEIGYRSIVGAAIEPWNSTVRRGIDLQEQADAYEAVFETFWDQPWFAGLYVWDWRPDHSRAGGITDDHFSPQNKPAQDVLRTWFGFRR
jgi:hypothetical protein